MKILIIRHGDPDYEHDNLTEKGKKEAELLSERLLGQKITSVYVSPLGRAKATAQPFLEKSGLAAKELPWLAEFGASVYPDYEGKGLPAPFGPQCNPWCVTPQYWSTEVDGLYDRKIWKSHKLFEKSDAVKLYETIENSFNSLMASHGYRRSGQIYHIDSSADKSQVLALFCHQGVGLAILSAIASIPPAQMWENFFFAPSSVSTIFMDEYPPYPMQSVAKIASIGDTSHLYAGKLEPSSAGLCTDMKKYH